LVITSRTSDYEALAERLRLQGAIIVRPLSGDQVNAYLTDLGPDGNWLRAALHEDASLWELLESPLLLNIVTLAYAGQSEVPLPRSSNVAELRDHLFGSYVSQMLKRRAAERRYTPKQTAHWLDWLARQMAKDGQTVFYLERPQRDWVPQKQRWAIQVCTVLFSMLVIGLVGGLEGGLAFGLVFGPVEGVQVALVMGLVVGLFAGLVVGLIGGLVLLRREIVCVETVRWSWSHCWRSRASIPVVALVGGMVGGLVGGLQGGLQAGLASGLVNGLIAGLVAGLVAGLTFGEIQKSAFPNEGMHRSARTALFVGLVLCLVVGLVVGLFGGPLFGLVGGLQGELSVGPWTALFNGLVFGLLGGLIGELVAGGEMCLKHVVLRLWLIRNGSTPWNYVRFLDYAAERILLRKVGGGYAFIHRMLLEYFAERYVEPLVRGTPRLKPPAIENE
jgi:hypothetical protein